MGTALYGVDVVHIGIDALAEARIVLEGNIDWNDLVRGHRNGVRDELGSAGVQVVNKFLEAFFRVESVCAEGHDAGGFAFAVLTGNELLHFLTLVRKGDADAFVQVCQFTQAIGQGLVLVNNGLLENGGIRMEGDGGTGILGLPYHLNRRNGLALGVLLHKYFPFTVDFRNEEVAQGVYAGNTHAVQTAGNLIAVFVELTAGVQHGEHHFQGAPVLFLMHACRDTTPIVLYADGIVFQNLDIYAIAVAGHGFIDTVVYHLIHQVMQAALAYVSNIHGRTLADGLQAFQHLDTVCGILLFRHFHLIF